MAFDQYLLKDLPVSIIDGDRGKAYPKRSEFTKSGHCLFLNAGNVTSTGFDFSDCSFISEERHSLLRKGTLQRGDSVLTTRGTVGNVSFYGDSVPFETMRINSGMVIFRCDESVLDPLFFYWFLRSSQFSSQVELLTTGSAQPQLPIRDIKEISASLPQLVEQKAIANVIATLDDKIELNRKTNETLEGIAKALFKSWFVDFDPVRAKAEGRPTGLPDEISELFPDSFEESELGEIPSGWSISSIKDQSSYLSRGISPKYCEDHVGVVVLNQKCIRGGAIDFSKSRRHDPTKKKIDGRVISKFDCLVNSTGVGTLGRVAIVPGLIFGDVIVDSHVTVVRGGSKHSTFYLTNTLLNRQPEIEALGEGSTGQTELSRAVLGEMELVLPPEGLLNAFYSSTVCLFEKRWLNEAESEILSSIRDVLLPRLISGELRVPDTEKMLEGVGI